VNRSASKRRLRSLGAGAALFASLGLAIACETGAGGSSIPQARLPTVEIQLGSEIFTLEVADTPESQKIGLMGRETLGPSDGMLFVFEDRKNQSFWMKNTKIALDIAFVTNDGRIARLATMQPLSYRSHHSGRPCRYAIELASGSFERLGLREGDIINISEQDLKRLHQSDDS
jgi:hypothetical protein